MVLREELHCVKQSGEPAVVATESEASELLDITQKLGSVMVSTFYGLANKSPHSLVVSGRDSRQEDKEEQVSSDVLAHNLSQFVVVSDRHSIVALSGQVNYDSWAEPS